MNFEFYVEQTFVDGDPVIGLWDDAAFVGGMLIRTPSSGDSFEADETLAEAFRAEVGAETFARLEAFEATMNGNSPKVDGGYYYIDTIAVDPSHHGKGYARVLIEHVIGMSASDPDAVAVCLSTEDPGNHGLYEHLGFDKISQATVGPVTTTSFRRWTT